jgi:hypothetical protein
MKTFVVGVLLSLTICAQAETFRGVASAERPSGRITAEVVVIYDRTSPMLVSSTNEQDKQRSVDAGHSAKISVRWNGGDPEDYDFVVTQYPDVRGSSLFGYFFVRAFTGIIPVSVRIDAWDPAQSLFIYHPRISPDTVLVGASSQKKP